MGAARLATLNPQAYKRVTDRRRFRMMAEFHPSGVKLARMRRPG